MISGKPKPSVQAKWQAIIEAQERSGLDVVEYCRTNGLCRSGFYGRRKQLRQVLPAKTGFLQLMPHAEANQFTPVASCETPVNIRTPNGYQIGLRLPDKNGLATLLGILKGL
jgi:hypothetical protein